MRARAVAALLLVVLTCSACMLPEDDEPAAAGISYTCSGTSGDATGIANLTPEMAANAKLVADYALANGFGKAGALVGITSAWTESTLNAAAVHPSGRWVGLFQMSAAWVAGGEDRTNPMAMTTMFYQGSPYGHPGLKDIAGWEQMPPGQAAATVEGNLGKLTQYIGNEGIGKQITDAIVTGTSCTTGSTVGVNGVNVTLPAHPEVPQALQGKVIVAPTEGIAKGLGAGFGKLGLPYVWGGGGDGAAENDGCTRGGGSLNSCQGIIGFDCSGLTAYVLVQGGYPTPGGTSITQRGSGQSVSYDQGLPGDIVGFPGHVAIYLGVIDGKPYILEASTVGTPIHVTELRRSDKDGMLHRHWNGVQV